MLDYYLRPALQQMLIAPIADRLQYYNFCSANVVTSIALLFGLLAAILTWNQWPMLACTLLIFSGYCDVLDGSIARLKQQTSAIGTVYDIVADRIVEISIMIALYFINPNIRATPCILMLSSVLLCVTSFLVVGIVSENKSEKSFHYSPGLIERAEAFLFFIAMILLPKHFVILSYMFSFLVFITTLLRIAEFRNKSINYSV
jgi:archaetidylinositol phosphate synthase